MTRLQQNDEITSEMIFETTNNGLSVFEKELDDFSLTRNIKNPFIIDRNPSCRIKQSSSGIWLLNVYNDNGGFYNAITFIKKKYNLNYYQALDYIYNNKSLKTENKDIIIEEKQPLLYSFKKQPYTQQHIDYYCIEGLTESFLTNEMDIYAVDTYGINNSPKKPLKDQFMFAYAYKNILGEYQPNLLKLLTLGPNVDKKDKWRNNLLPFNFYYTYKIKPNTTVFVGKSNKDCTITQFCGITSIAAMSENKNNIITGLKNLIQIFPTVNFVVNLGNDLQGKQTSIEISKELNLQWFNTPNNVLNNGINDNFEYVKTFGMNSFKKLLKNKNYIK